MTHRLRPVAHRGAPAPATREFNDGLIWTIASGCPPGAARPVSFARAHRTTNASNRVALWGGQFGGLDFAGGRGRCTTAARWMRLLPREAITRHHGSVARHYGLLLVYLYPGGRLFNDELVREGYERGLTIAPNVGRAGELRAATRLAREQQRGLWGACQLGAAQWARLP